MIPTDISERLAALEARAEQGEVQARVDREQFANRLMDAERNIQSGRRKLRVTWALSTFAALVTLTIGWHKDAIAQGYGMTLAQAATRIAALETKTASMSVVSASDSTNTSGQQTVRFSGVNVQIVDGNGDTENGQSGVGNLIIGYNEQRGGTGANADVRIGNHNLIVGLYNNYSGNGGVVFGYQNNISGLEATVTGGAYNKASGNQASVNGGLSNEASGNQASVSGGYGNTASGLQSSVSGGSGNVAKANYASVSGGYLNMASGSYSNVSGGEKNTASGDYSSVSGGGSNFAGNIASGLSSSVSGGALNIASGNYSSVSGGVGRTAPNMNNWVAGTQAVQ